MTPQAIMIGSINARMAETTARRNEVQNRYMELARTSAPGNRPFMVGMDLDALSQTLRELTDELADLEQEKLGLARGDLKRPRRWAALAVQSGTNERMRVEGDTRLQAQARLCGQAYGPKPGTISFLRLP